MIKNLLRLQFIIGRQLGIEPNRIESSARFIEELGADSLDLVELVMAIEDEFDVQITEQAANQIKTVQDVLNYIERCSNKKLE